MKQTRQAFWGTVLGAVGLLFSIGAGLFKVAVKVIGDGPNGSREWALRLSSVQLAVALCLIAAGGCLRFFPKNDPDSSSQR